MEGTQMTLKKALSIATRKFFETKSTASFRGIDLYEMSGNDKNCDYVLFRFSYCINGDYTESDTKGFYVSVRNINGTIVVD